MVDLLFATSPFKERRQDFNVWGLCPPAAESGISRPSTGKHRRSPVGTTYDAFGSERYVLTFENRAFRDIASFAPYRRRGDHRQRPDVRRRRHFQSLCDGGRGQPVGAVRVRSRVRAPFCWSCRRVLHVGCRLPSQRAARRAVGGECHSAPRSGTVEVEGSGRARHAPADAVAQGGVRGAIARLPAAAPRHSRRQQAGSGDGGALPQSSRRRMRRSSRPARTPTPSARSKAPCTKRAAIIGRRRIASCSRATRCRFAACARERSRA